MLFLLAAGIILRATSGWFADQHQVGDILIWVGGLTTLIPLLVIGVIAILTVDR